jgi:hypothetical protein
MALITLRAQLEYSPYTHSCTERLCECLPFRRKRYVPFVPDRFSNFRTRGVVASKTRADYSRRWEHCPLFRTYSSHLGENFTFMSRSSSWETA